MSYQEVVDHLISSKWYRLRFRIVNVFASFVVYVAYHTYPRFCIPSLWPYGPTRMHHLFYWLSGDPHYDPYGADLIGVNGWQNTGVVGR